MKKTFIVAAMACCALTANARKGFYVDYGLGVGLTNVARQGPVSANHYSALTGHNFQVSAGYRYKKWHLEAGLQRSTTGFQQKGLLFGSSFPDSVGRSYAQWRYTHLAAPLKAGYEIPLSSRFSLMPMCIIAPGYNLGETSVLSIDGDKTKTNMTGSDFKSAYNRFSLWTGIELRAQYQFEKRVSVFLAPRFEYMVTNFLKSGGYPINIYHNYAYTLNVGMRIDLGKKAS